VKVDREKIKELLTALDDYAREVSPYEYGLPTCLGADDGDVEAMIKIVQGWVDRL
jgi:hypothetical protein